MVQWRRLALAVVPSAVLLGGAAFVLSGEMPLPLIQDDNTAPSPSATTEAPTYLIGTVIVDEISARVAPDDDAGIIATFEPVNEQGAPQAFLLRPDSLDEDDTLPDDTRWVRALLPMRPNGTEGYLPVNGLDVRTTQYRILVDRLNFSLTVFDGNEIVLDVPVGIGTGKTPTPVGTFYLASLLKPPDPTTVYGTYAYGLSGYSETLKNWREAGIIGLHGTNNASKLGTQVSHGCIRMRNSDIEKLVPILPLGTPIVIL